MTLVELLAAASVMGMTAVGASAMFPMSAVMQHRSGSYSQAATVVERKLEQVRKLPIAELDYEGLRAAGIIDASTDGSFMFTSADALSPQFSEGAGRITVSDEDEGLAKVDILVTWRGYDGRPNRVAATTLVAAKDPAVEN